MKRPDRPRTSPRAFAIAVGLHVVAVVVLVRALTFGHGLPSWLDFGGPATPTEERLQYVTTMPSSPERVSVVRRPPPPAEVRVQSPLSGPVEDQAGSPRLPLVSRDTSSGAPAAGVGTLDPNLRGVRPGYTDERVWRGVPGGQGGTGGEVVATGDRADKLDSIMAGILTAARDSLDSIARAQGKYGRQPGDWTTTDKNGRKWGWDQQGIKLGKVVIPNALLALLPLNATTAASMSGNMARMDADRRIAASRADIQRMSERGIGEAEFRRVVKEMDARRDTERRERLRAPSASLAAPVKSSDKSGDRQNDRE
jgi:hypothetical protein